VTISVEALIWQLFDLHPRQHLEWFRKQGLNEKQFRDLDLLCHVAKTEAQRITPFGGKLGECRPQGTKIAGESTNFYVTGRSTYFVQVGFDGLRCRTRSVREWSEAVELDAELSELKGLAATKKQQGKTFEEVASVFKADHELWFQWEGSCRTIKLQTPWVRNLDVVSQIRKEMLDAVSEQRPERQWRNKDALVKDLRVRWEQSLRRVAKWISRPAGWCATRKMLLRVWDEKCKLHALTDASPASRRKRVYIIGTPSWDRAVKRVRARV